MLIKHAFPAAPPASLGVALGLSDRDKFEMDCVSKHQPPRLLHALSNSADATSTVSFGHARASSNRLAGATDRPTHSVGFVGDSIRSRNSALRWKDRVSSRHQAVANMRRRRSDCAAPCCSPAQISSCERASRLSLYFVVRWRAPVLSLALGGCAIPASITGLQASLSSVFFSLRQLVISSASGMNSLQSLSTSGVQARRCSSVPWAKHGANEAVAASAASNILHRAKANDRTRTALVGLAMLIEGPPCIVEIYATSS
jgi:hypothetical protein